MMERNDLSCRELATLRAVEAGRAELLVSCVPNLRIDGGWCDHVAVLHLIAEDLIVPARQVAVGWLVRACITEKGRNVLHPVSDAA